MSRRRAHEDDDGYERAYRKRRRVSENQEIEDRLESLILRVGEKSTSSLESNLEGLASVLEADLSTFRAKILRILTDCAIRMPEKCTIYTTLVGLLNAKNFNFGGEFVEYMVKSFKESLKQCKWDAARYALRFLADLVNCHVISATSLLQLLDNMMDTANEDNVPQVRRDWYVFAILSTLPWVGRELYEKKEKSLEHLMIQIEIFLNKRSKKHHNALRVWAIDSPHPQEEYLDCLWAQVRKLRQDNWAEKHIPRPYLAFDSILCEALQHNLASIIPPPHHDTYEYPMPWVVFRLFDYTDCPEGPTLPGAHSIERFLIEEHLHSIIELYHLERKDCAAHLLNFPYKLKIPLEYCIVEVIFGELLHMPKPRYLEIAYGAILIELCKLQPSTMPQVLAQATEMLFVRIDTMNVSCFDRFVSWFAYHLSNFQFRWSWEDWDTCLSLDDDHPKPKFIRETMLKCMRLSYFQRIREILPESFSKFIPEKPEPDYKYAQEGAAALPGTEAAHKLVVSIRQKCTPEEVLAVLKDLPNPRTEEEADGRFNPLKIDVFVQTLLNLGSKSFSHSFAAISKFHYVFKILAESEAAQICILRNMFELWHNHQQMMIVLVDKMLKTQIVECSAVANWIFSKEMTSEFTKMYLWEILHLTIKKMNKHVIKLGGELNEAREKLARAESSDSESEDDESKKKQDDAEKPTEEMVERMEEKLELAHTHQKNLFLIIFQRFIMILSEHLVRCDTDGKDYSTHWYKWTIGRLQQVFLAHHEQVQKYSSTLETLLFTQDLDHHILEIFQQFVSLRA
ncbi:nuclear cap-binding protein subunit 1 [Diorhabda carinulata]|uniref:LOW QUALITY PROTEIN: nuclear cap-binding protein subunit 1-like n=1 Tax=Diorhabda sublineata TaxID=1163346 RepID=UPI0024E08907|nr:LOW QUALITY PROTEIN: nuclear cap-binding protein subunit 1-like [Diorhabda sublineata]XP_057667360.1 nuclear cap-binding protein subunit 1 [Diorhabda carinulata]